MYKECPELKISCNLDVLKYLGYFLQPSESSVTVGISSTKITFKSGFAGPGGCILSFNFEMARAQKIHTKNVMLLHW